MFEESVSSIPSIWASMNSWFTPAVFFVLLNVMIGTIAFTSNLANLKQQRQDSTNSPHPQPPPPPPKLATSPSVLQRLKSINFSTFRSQEPRSLNLNLEDLETHFNFQPTHKILSDHNQEENPSEIAKRNDESFVYQESHLQKSTQEENTDWQSENTGSGEEIQSLDEVYSKLNGRHVSRSKSDTKPVAGEFPKKLPGKMKKSATMKSAFKHFEMEDIVETQRPATVKEKSSNSKTDVVDEEVDAKADDFINKFKQQLQLQRLDSIVRYKEMIGRGNGK